MYWYRLHIFVGYQENTKLRNICHLAAFSLYMYVVTDKTGGQKMINNSEFHVLLLTNKNVKSVPVYG